MKSKLSFRASLVSKFAEDPMVVQSNREDTPRGESNPRRASLVSKFSQDSMVPKEVNSVSNANKAPTASELVQQLNTPEAPKQLSDDALLEDYNKRHKDGYIKRIANNFDNRVNSASDSLSGTDNIGETALKVAAVPIGAVTDVIGEIPESYFNLMANDPRNKGKFKGSLPQVMDTITSKMGENSQAFAGSNPRLASDLDAYTTVVGGLLPFAGKLSPKVLSGKKGGFNTLADVTKKGLKKDINALVPDREISLTDLGTSAQKELTDKYNLRNTEKNSAYSDVKPHGDFEIPLEYQEKILPGVSEATKATEGAAATPDRVKLAENINSVAKDMYKKLLQGKRLTGNDLVELRKAANSKINWRNFSETGNKKLYEFKGNLNEALDFLKEIHPEFGSALSKADALNAKLKTDFPNEDPQFRKFFDRDIHLDNYNQEKAAAKGEEIDSKSIVVNDASDFVKNLNSTKEGTLGVLLRNLSPETSRELLTRALKLHDETSGGKFKNLVKAAINFTPGVNLPLNISQTPAASKLRAMSKDIQTGSKRAPLFASKPKPKAKSGSSPLFEEENISKPKPSKSKKKLGNK